MIIIIFLNLDSGNGKLCYYSIGIELVKKRH